MKAYINASPLPKGAKGVLITTDFEIAKRWPQWIEVEVKDKQEEDCRY